MIQFPLRTAPAPPSPSHAHQPSADSAPCAGGEVPWAASHRVVGMTHANCFGSFLAIVPGGVKDNPTNRFVTTFFPSLIS